MFFPIVKETLTPGEVADIVFLDSGRLTAKMDPSSITICDGFNELFEYGLPLESVKKLGSVLHDVQESLLHFNILKHMRRHGLTSDETEIKEDDSILGFGVYLSDGTNLITEDHLDELYIRFVTAISKPDIEPYLKVSAFDRLIVRDPPFPEAN